MNSRGSLETIPYRPVRLGPLTPVVERSRDGTIRIRVSESLGPYEARATDRLVHWARTAPNRDFLAWRGANGDIERLTYGDTFTTIRRLGQALLDRGASADRPVVILSANSRSHALLTLAAMHVGACCVPVSPAYSLVSRDFGILGHVMSKLTPSLVFAESGMAYDRAIAAALPTGVPLVVASHAPSSRPSVLFSDLAATEPTGDVEAAWVRVTPDHVAKILFTSGSTGVPKGVVNTHRMLTSNQQMIAQLMPFLADEPPVMVDWLPWHHTFGGNHNLGLVIQSGGCLFIDEGKPLPGAFDASVRNLREVNPTVYLNVPSGFDELIAALRRDDDLRKHFFARLRLCFYAAASLSQAAADELQSIAVDTCGERIVLMTALGSTETAPLVVARTWPSARTGSIGLPAPGVEVRLVPAGEKLELRVRGPNITPGYFHEPELTRKAFDEEGFYRLGDAVRFVNPNEVKEGFQFDGRLAEDFKLASGTWVNVGVLRARVIAHFAPYLRDAVITGHDRSELGMMVVPDLDRCRTLRPVADGTPAEVLRDPAVRVRFAELLASFAVSSTGNASRIARAVLLEEPPSLDAHEMTDKGSLNQRAILTRRAAIVEALYAPEPGADIILARGSNRS